MAPAGIPEVIMNEREKAFQIHAGERPRPVVLASVSEIRAEMLHRAGLEVEVVRPGVDEEEIKAALLNEGARPNEIAETLAETKAVRVSLRRDQTLVIGADQVLDCDGDVYDKPGDRGQAAAHLRQLRGRRHRLNSAVCVALDGTALWRHIDRAEMTMRDFSDDFIEHYLDSLGAVALTSVGAYQLEGLGAQLFDHVEGDYFTILGLPLLPLLAFLRGHGIVAA